MKATIHFNRFIIALCIFVGFCLLCANCESDVKFYTSKLCGAAMIAATVPLGKILNKEGKI